MISRVAENCFWLNRYVERAEGTARMMFVNRLVVLDAEIHEAKRWKPLIAALGETARFERLVGEHGYDNDKKAEEYLTWSSDNPSSIVSSLAGARENARTTREVISREMWETVNTVWQWLASPGALKLYRKDRLEFYEKIRGGRVEITATFGRLRRPISALRSPNATVPGTVAPEPVGSEARFLGDSARGVASVGAP